MPDAGEAALQRIAEEDGEAARIGHVVQQVLRAQLIVERGQVLPGQNRRLRAPGCNRSAYMKIVEAHLERRSKKYGSVNPSVTLSCMVPSCAFRLSVSPRPRKLLVE